jgi:hypothetical protein
MEEREFCVLISIVARGIVINGWDRFKERTSVVDDQRSGLPSLVTCNKVRIRSISVRKTSEELALVKLNMK